MLKLVLIQYGINLSYAYDELKQYLIDNGQKLQFDRIELQQRYPINNHLRLPYDLMTINQLPIILLMIKNYQAGEDIFSNLEEQFNALKTDLYYDFNKIKKIRLNVESQLKKSAKYDMYGHYFTEGGILSGIISLFWIKKNCPGVINITGGPFGDLFPSFYDILVDIGLVDCQVNGDGHESLNMIIDLYQKNEKIPKLMDNQIIDINNICRPISIGPNGFNHNIPTAFLFGSRGCFGRCTYCLENRKMRILNFNNLMLWIDTIIEKGIYRFYFMDVTFNHSKKFIRKFYSAMKDRGLIGKISIDFTYVRVDLIDEEIIQIFKELDAFLYVGVESFSAKVLKSMKKDYDYDYMVNILDSLKKSKISFTVGRIFCYPGESLEDFYHSCKMFNRYRYCNASNFVLIPNTEIYLNPDEYNIKILAFPEVVSNIIPKYKSKVEGIPMTYIETGDPDAKIYEIKLKKIRRLNYFHKKIERLRSFLGKVSSIIKDV